MFSCGVTSLLSLPCMKCIAQMLVAYYLGSREQAVCKDGYVLSLYDNHIPQAQPCLFNWRQSTLTVGMWCCRSSLEWMHWPSSASTRSLLLPCILTSARSDCWQIFACSTATLLAIAISRASRVQRNPAHVAKRKLSDWHHNSCMLFGDAMMEPLCSMIFQCWQCGGPNFTMLTTVSSSCIASQCPAFTVLLLTLVMLTCMSHLAFNVHCIWR